MSVKEQAEADKERTRLDGIIDYCDREIRWLRAEHRCGVRGGK